MLDGLEISNIKFSEIRNTLKFRFDSEYYKKAFITNSNIIKSIKHSNIGNELDVLTDFHANGSYEDISKHFKLLDCKDYAYMVRTTDLESENYENDVKYVSKSCYEYLSKSKVYGGEVLINKIGSPGLTYLMPHLNKPVSLGMNLFMLKMKQDSAIDNVTLYLYLNSKIGKSLITRDINGTVPLTIDKESIRSILVPVFTNTFKSYLSQILNKREETFKLSNRYYTQAEEILNKELNITKIENTKTYSVRSFSTSYGKSKRLDSEYYQDKYDKLFPLIKNPENLSNIVIITKSIEPGSDEYKNEGVPFIRVSDLSKFGISDTNVYLDKTKYKSVIKPKKNSILFSKDGSIGIAYKVEDDIDAITSGALLHLTIRTHNVLPDYLTLVLNSSVVQLQAERDSGGSIIEHWRLSEIEDVLIPILDYQIQSQISQKVQQSFKLRKQSKELLEKAVKAVEIAIEQGEEKAISWLKENTNEYFMNNE